MSFTTPGAANATVPFAAWLGHEVEFGRLRLTTIGRSGAVALSSLACFQILRFLTHDTLAGVDEDCFVQAWTELFVEALT